MVSNKSFDYENLIFPIGDRERKFYILARGRNFKRKLFVRINPNELRLCTPRFTHLFRFYTDVNERFGGSG